MEATIRLEYYDEKGAAAIAAAISPDNSCVPSGLSVRTYRKKCCVITEIKIEDRMSTFISTIDDLLFSFSVAEKALNVARKV